MKAIDISDELRAGIAAYDRRIAAIGGYGVRVSATVRDRSHTVREGVLVELGFGGCQPGIETDDGRRYAVDASFAIVRL